MGSLVGFVTLFGIAMRNGILLISHYRHLERVDGIPIDQELIIRGAMERLVPILMTAGSAALGLLPLVALGKLPGNEIEHPMAAVILGGLVSSTFLTLFILPVLYEWYARACRRSKASNRVKSGTHPIVYARNLATACAICVAWRNRRGQGGCRRSRTSLNRRAFSA